MDEHREERRFARWRCDECQSPRYAPLPKDGWLKCPICYAVHPFDPRKHAHRDRAHRGKAPAEIPIGES